VHELNKELLNTKDEKIKSKDIKILFLLINNTKKVEK